ncbi:MAG: hypothetical protein EOL87_18550 [Spartobacteria bacterium]|nr:hypothetical protein [Spartobacteria bacterium]
MMIPVTLSWPNFSFWGWVWFLLGAGIAGYYLLLLALGLVGLMFGHIGNLKKRDSSKTREWKDERDRIATAIVRAKSVEKLEQLQVSLAEESTRQRTEFERLVRQHREDTKSEYFSKLGLYCGLLSFFRSIEEDANEDYYRLKILGVPVVSVRSEELLEGESSQINESMYLDHSFLTQYIMPASSKTRRLASGRHRI